MDDCTCRNCRVKYTERYSGSSSSSGNNSINSIINGLRNVDKHRRLVVAYEEAHDLVLEWGAFYYDVFLPLFGPQGNNWTLPKDLVNIVFGFVGVNSPTTETTHLWARARNEALEKAQEACTAVALSIRHHLGHRSQY